MKESTFDKYCLVVDEWFVNGFNGTKAYQRFYPKVNEDTAAVKFSELVRIGKIQEYKKSKTKSTSSELQITLISQLNELTLIKDSDKASPSDKINAIKEQNKLLALYKDHNEQKSFTINWHEEKTYDPNV
jgi:hypothetical protein